VIIQHTYEALEHFAPRARHLAQHHLSRQLPAKVTLFVGYRIEVEVIEKFWQDIESLRERRLEGGSYGLGAVFYSTQELLRNPNPFAQFRERQIMKEANES
jgi:hypothetical protein